MIESETRTSMKGGNLVQAVFLQIAIEFPVVVAANVHFCENDAEHALVKSVVGLVRTGWSYA